MATVFQSVNRIVNFSMPIGFYSETLCPSLVYFDLYFAIVKAV
jgi:hypothetical protein